VVAGAHPRPPGRGAGACSAPFIAARPALACPALPWPPPQVAVSSPLLACFPLVMCVCGISCVVWCGVVWGGRATRRRGPRSAPAARRRRRWTARRGSWTRATTTTRRTTTNYQAQPQQERSSAGGGKGRRALRRRRHQSLQTVCRPSRLRRAATIPPTPIPARPQGWARRRARARCGAQASCGSRRRGRRPTPTTRRSATPSDTPSRYMYHHHTYLTDAWPPGIIKASRTTPFFSTLTCLHPLITTLAIIIIIPIPAPRAAAPARGLPLRLRAAVAGQPHGPGPRSRLPLGPPGGAERPSRGPLALPRARPTPRGLEPVGAGGQQQ